LFAEYSEHSKRTYEEGRNGVSEEQSYEDILHALRVRVAGNPWLRDLPA
jgi:hypothetical protein